jgi:formyl-CoA transferase
VEEWTKTKTVAEIVDELLAIGVPAAPIYNIAQVAADPHIAGAREMFVDIVHPKAGPIKITGPHIKLSDTKPSIRTPSPALGEHNEEVLSSMLGMTKDEIEALKQEGVL